MFFHIVFVDSVCHRCAEKSARNEMTPIATARASIGLAFHSGAKIKEIGERSIKLKVILKF